MNAWNLAAPDRGDAAGEDGGAEGAPSAAVVIPHYNDTARLRRCLSALMPQAARRRVEIVVADNGSTEDMNWLSTDFPEVRLVVETEKGAAPARNAGVAATRAPWLFFIDADCVPSEDWLEQAMTKGGREVIVGGRVDLFDETPPPRSGAEAFETVFAFHQHHYVTRKYFSVTANMLVTRAMFSAVGGFDGSVVEDHDWCLRARAKGYGIEYHDDLVVRHPTRQDWTALARKWRRTTNENYFLNGTRPVDRLRWALRAGAVLLSAMPHLPSVLYADKLTGREKLAGAATLVRLRLARAGWMLRQALLGDRRQV